MVACLTAGCSTEAVVALQAYHVPYTAMTVHVSETSQGRDSATAYRMCFEVLSVLFAAVFQGLVVAQLGGGSASACRNCTATGDPDSAGGDHKEDRNAYLVCAIVIGSIMVVCGSITFFGIQERPQLEGAWLQMASTLWIQHQTREGDGGKKICFALEE